MFPYVLVFLIFATGALTQAQGRRGFFQIVIAAFAVMIGLRYQVGADWPIYDILFDEVGRLSLLQTLAKGDPAYHLLAWTAQQLGLGLWAVNLVCAAIFGIGLARFAGRQPNPWLAVLVAFPVLCVIVAMSATRQSVAIGFVFLALCEFSDGKITRFLAFIALGALFHASAILMLPLCALSYTRNRLQSAIVILFGAALAYYALTSQFGVYAGRYAATLESKGAIFRLGMNVIPGLLYLTAPSRFAPEIHDRILWRNISFLAILSIALLAVVPSSTSIDRLGLYIAPLQMFVLSRLPYVYGRTQADRTLLTLAVIAFCGLVLFVFFNFSTHGRYWLPYEFVPLS